MRSRPWFIALIGLALAAAALVLFSAACSNKKSGNSADTPTALSTMAQTPMATSETPAAETGTPMAAGTSQPGTVTVNLAEWQIIPQPASVASGSVTFNVKNIGSEKHEMVLVRSHADPGALPTLADGSADEAQLDVVDEVADLAAGAQGTFTADMTPGNYVMICNVVDTEMGHIHYKQGMATAFTVTG